MFGVLITSAQAVPSVDEPRRTGHAGAGAAVVVGLEDYAFLPDVPYAARDAAVMADALTVTVGLGAERVTHLRTANREQLLAAVTAARDRAGDGPVYVYFAGHGATGPDGGLRLVGDDAKAEADVFVARSVPVRDVAAAAGPRAVLWLDTCWAGTGRGGEALIPGARFAVPAYAAEPQGDVWTAASPSEVSLPYEPARHGLFTYFLAGALRGWADGELGAADGRVETDEAWAYVQRSLRSVEAAQAPQRAGVAVTAVLSSGALESGPTLSELPRAGRVQVVAGPAPAGRTLAPPFVRVGSSARDAAGRTVSFDELSSLGLAAAVEDGARRARSARTIGLVGLGVGAAGLAGVGGVLAAAAASHGSWSEYQSLCTQGLRTDARCDEAEPGTSPVALALTSGATVAGLGVSVGGFLGVGRARQRVVDQANQELR